MDIFTEQYTSPSEYTYHLIGLRVARVKVIQFLGDPFLLDIGTLGHHLVWWTTVQIL